MNTTRLLWVCFRRLSGSVLRAADTAALLRWCGRIGLTALAMALAGRADGAVV